MRGEPRNVRIGRFPPQQVEILAERFKTPVDASAQRIERHRLDLGQVGKYDVAATGWGRRDPEAAIADNDRSYPQCRRWRSGLIPGQLRVVMRMQIDDPWCEHQPFGIDRFRGSFPNAADADDATTPDRKVTLDQCVPETVGDPGIPEYKVVHTRQVSPAVPIH